MGDLSRAFSEFSPVCAEIPLRSLVQYFPIDKMHKTQENLSLDSREKPLPNLISADASSRHADGFGLPLPTMVYGKFALRRFENPLTFLLKYAILNPPNSRKGTSP
jgi:hypothetical protein